MMELRYCSPFADQRREEIHVAANPIEVVSPPLPCHPRRSGDHEEYDPSKLTWIHAAPAQNFADVRKV